MKPMEITGCGCEQTLSSIPKKRPDEMDVNDFITSLGAKDTQRVEAERSPYLRTRIF